MVTGKMFEKRKIVCIFSKQIAFGADASEGVELFTIFSRQKVRLPLRMRVRRQVPQE